MAKKNQGKHVKPSTPEAAAPESAKAAPAPAQVAAPDASAEPQAAPAPASSQAAPDASAKPQAAPAQAPAKTQPAQAPANPQAAPDSPTRPSPGPTPGNPRLAAAASAPQPQSAAPALLVMQATAALPPAQAAAPMGSGAWQMSAIPPESAHHRGLKIFGIVMGVLIALLAAVYFAGVFVFSGRFFPHTTILDMDVSGKTPEEVHLMLDDMLGDYTFTVQGHGLDLTLASRDMGMSLDSESIADGLLSRMNPWAWPYEVFQAHDNTDDLVSTFEDTKLGAAVQAAVAAVNAQAAPPKNADLAFDESLGAYRIVPEEEGATLVAEEVLSQIMKGTVNFAPTVQLTDEVLEQPTRTQDDPTLAAAREQANKYLEGAVNLVFAGQTALAVDASTIAQNIKIGKDFEVKFNPAPIVKDVQEKVDKMDTTGAKRTYTRPDGKTITVEGGDYGWITDSEATAKKVKKALETGEGGTIEIVMKLNAGQYPDENGRDFGNRFIDVDLTKQVAVFYDEDGKVIWKSKIVSGLPKNGRNTPTGTYWLKTNDGASVLKGFKPDGSKDYETPVNYWMPFKDNSVGFHDADWQARFGGDWYKSHGSHGCVNLPVDKAKKLHKLVKVGDAVVVHN